MKYPFEAPFSELHANLDTFISSVFSCLESEFLVLPKGDGFVEYPTFERGYEYLKQMTRNFQDIEVAPVLEAVFQTPISLIVLRTMLGFTPSEWAYVTSQRTGVEVTQGFVRSLDRSVRIAPLTPWRKDRISRIKRERIAALIETACQLLKTPLPRVGSDKIHRLDKADTRDGPDGIRALAGMGVPYAVLLYERFLGRPFAGHRVRYRNWSATFWNRLSKTCLPRRV